MRLLDVLVFDNGQKFTAEISIAAGS